MTTIRGGRFRWIIAASTIIALVVASGLFLADSSASIWFLVGIVLPPGILMALRIVPFRLPWSRVVAYIRVALIFAVGLGLFLLILLIFVATTEPGFQRSPLPPPLAKQYEVEIYPTGEAEFAVTEEVVVDLGEQGEVHFDAGGGQFRSSPETWALLRAEILPLSAHGGRVVIDTDGGTPVTGSLCTYTCPVTRVKLRDFPKGRFLRPHGASATSVPAGLGTENINWIPDQPDEGIVFYYYREPYQHFRPVIDRFAAVASLGSLALAVLGIAWVAATAAVAIVIGLAKDWFRDKVKARLFATRPQNE